MQNLQDLDDLSVFFRLIVVLTTVCWSGHGLLIILLWHSKYVLIVFHDLGGIELAQWR